MALYDLPYWFVLLSSLQLSESQEQFPDIISNHSVLIMWLTNAETSLSLSRVKTVKRDLAETDVATLS